MLREPCVEVASTGGSDVGAAELGAAIDAAPQVVAQSRRLEERRTG